MNELRIETGRLRLIAANRELLSCDLAGAEQLCEALGVGRPVDWPPEGSEYDQAAIRFFLDTVSTRGEEAAGWYTWYVLLHSAQNQNTDRDRVQDRDLQLVGNCGFFGPPDERGRVEIGYSVCKEWRNKGIATEMVAALLRYAWSNDTVKKVLARTRSDNLASIRALRRNGFQEIACEEGEKLQFQCLRHRSAFSV